MLTSVHTSHVACIHQIWNYIFTKSPDIDQSLGACPVIFIGLNILYKEVGITPEQNKTCFIKFKPEANLKCDHGKNGIFI